MSVSFAHLGLPKPLVRALAERDITEPFPIQAAAIPDVLAGRDVSGKAPTGSGKTLAFGLPIIAQVPKATRNRPRALILVPTRELAEQIKRELSSHAKAMRRFVFAVYGGVGYGPQKSSLRRGVDVLVATPGRLEDLIEQQAVELGSVTLAVVDEADRMADMGFLPAVRRILDRTNANRQTLLFSATLDGDVEVLSRTYQRQPVLHEALAIEAETIDARHHFWLVDHHDRVDHTARLVETMGSSIVFTRTRHGADRLAKQLARGGVGAVAIHGGRSQGQRSRALAAFTSGSAQALVATDVAARGIHIDDVAAVIHFDPAGDHKDYLHRSGRTARAGAAGTVVSLVTEQQRRLVLKMQRAMNLHAPIEMPRVEAIGSGGHRVGDHNGGQVSSGRAPSSPAAKRTASPDSSRVTSLYVANLPWSATADEVAALFGKSGLVLDSTVIADNRTGRSKGFGFVAMASADARLAIDDLNGSEFRGRQLTVRSARPRRGASRAAHTGRRRKVR